MDSITNFPKSRGHTVIWVIMDRFTKLVHFVGLLAKFSAEKLASLFPFEIIHHYGTPKSFKLNIYLIVTIFECGGKVAMICKLRGKFCNIVKGKKIVHYTFIVKGKNN